MPVTGPFRDSAATVGYGQLSISPSAAETPDKARAAGIWALEAPATEIDALKAAGPASSAAVVAYSDGQAVWAQSKIGPAISGESDSSQGVYGKSNTGAGVVGESTTNNGVYGISHSPQTAAVAGRNMASGAQKLAGYFDGDVTVTGQVSSAGVACGDISVNGKVNVTGTVTAFDLICPGADCAEIFETDRDSIDPGTVMVVGEEERLLPCAAAYDSRVAGVVSGADGYRPGLILNGAQTNGNRRAIALIGRVYCKADASWGSIEIGDLLTTSPTQGHAMRAQDAARSFGATLGKALRPLREGQGLIPVLVALQ